MSTFYYYLCRCTNTPKGLISIIVRVSELIGFIRYIYAWNSLNWLKLNSVFLSPILFSFFTIMLGSLAYLLPKTFCIYYNWNPSICVLCSFPITATYMHVESSPYWEYLHHIFLVSNIYIMMLHFIKIIHLVWLVLHSGTTKTSCG